MRIETTIMVDPTPKARARHTVVAGHVRSYTPAKTASAETQILYHLRQQLAGAFQFDKGVPLRLTVTFFRARPKAAPKRVTMPVTRPDLDNYVKLILDAISGYACADDAQVTTIVARKRFTTEQPRIYLLLEEDGE